MGGFVPARPGPVLDTWAMTNSLQLAHVPMTGRSRHFTILSAPPASHNLFTPTVVAQPSPSITTGTQQAQAARRPADQQTRSKEPGWPSPFFPFFPFCERACANCPGLLVLVLVPVPMLACAKTQLINRSPSRHQRLRCHLFPSSPASASQPFSLPFPWSITAHPPLDCPPPPLKA